MGCLDGTSAIVTGAARGIGAGIATVLAREGACVALTDLDLPAVREIASALAKSGGQTVALAHDVTKPASCAAVVADTIAAFGQVDVLVNNAGISERVAFASIDESAWDRMLSVNLKGPYLMITAVLDHMLSRGSGRIINVTSLLSKRGAPFFSHYAASKFGLVGLTQSLAGELAANNILVNAVAPGSVRTPLWDPELRAVAAECGTSPEEAWRDAVADIPLGRPQQPEDIGNVVAFLASAQAANITGETINVNGGQLMD